MTADSSKKEEKEMTTPASLASIAAQTKQPGTKSLGIGLEARGVHAWFGTENATGVSVQANLARAKLSEAAGTRCGVRAVVDI